MAAAIPAHADTPRIGMTVETSTEGFALNPVVTKITVTAVAVGSLAEAVGIRNGDEIMRINGQTLAGKRALDLQSLMKWAPGELRDIHLRHATGEQFDAKLTKPKA